MTLNVQVCKYIDIPLQHINNLTLLSMNRPPREHTEKLLHKLRQRIPGLVLRTTFISGFPGIVMLSQSGDCASIQTCCLGDIIAFKALTMKHLILHTQVIWLYLAVFAFDNRGRLAST